MRDGQQSQSQMWSCRRCTATLHTIHHGPRTGQSLVSVLLSTGISITNSFQPGHRTMSADVAGGLGRRTHAEQPCVMKAMVYVAQNVLVSCFCKDEEHSLPRCVALTFGQICRYGRGGIQAGCLSPLSAHMPRRQNDSYVTRGCGRFLQVAVSSSSESRITYPTRGMEKEKGGRSRASKVLNSQTRCFQIRLIPAATRANSCRLMPHA
jgi:hypothetical protein